MQQLMSLTWPEAEGIVFPEPVVPVAPSADPPALPAGNHHLLVPGDVARLMGANPVHQSGNYGAGVRVAMVDSGFAWKTHPFFQKHGYNVKTTRVPGDSGDPDVDANGHGTGESANFLAVAPKAELIGLRYYDVVAALGEVMKQKVAIVTNSWCTALKSDGPGAFWTPFYALLEQRLVEVAARGILIVFAAGNGHMSFTASLPYSISVGGVYSDANGKLLASSYASSYDTVRYASHAVPVETHVPEICGLCGMLPRARYILLPVPAGCQIDHEFAHPADGDAGDGTNPNDGWAVFSGTSAACPMVAGIIALILSKSPGLRLTEVRKKLYNSVDVSAGESRMKDMAASGYNKATGHGLANAEKSCS
jgi:subtilisin family serine protease